VNDLQARIRSNIKIFADDTKLWKIINCQENNGRAASRFE
jgi:hypothetical protein